jgi:hypothetical protein
MAPPTKTVSCNHFDTVRVVSIVEPGAIVFQIEKRSRWWPFWRRLKKRYPTQNAAVEVASAHLLVDDYVRRTVHEPHVVWKG